MGRRGKAKQNVGVEEKEGGERWSGGRIYNERGGGK